MFELRESIHGIADVTSDHTKENYHANCLLLPGMQPFNKWMGVTSSSYPNQTFIEITLPKSFGISSFALKSAGDYPIKDPMSVFVNIDGSSDYEKKIAEYYPKWNEKRWHSVGFNLR